MASTFAPIPPQKYTTIQPTAYLRWNGPVLEQRFEITTYVEHAPIGLSYEWRPVEVIPVPQGVAAGHEHTGPLVDEHRITRRLPDLTDDERDLPHNDDNGGFM